jgi:translation initiation factor 2-alpha kinase 4
LLSLPYNQRISFARYIARSGVTNIKRYWIGPVYIEKLKTASLHPREHIDASFDIVSSDNSDALIEIEILSVLNDVLNAFKELLITQQRYILVINYSYILNSILKSCGINTEHQIFVYKVLAEYNNKLNKSFEVSKDNRKSWLKDKLDNLNLSEISITKLVNYLVIYGEPERCLCELSQSEPSFCSKFAKEALKHIRFIISFLDSVGFKIPLIYSCSFVMPLVSLPDEYNGLMFQLLVRRKNNRNEYDILASGGNYDKLISKFRNKNVHDQHAVGISIDFERICFLVNEKNKPNIFRNEVAVCCLVDTRKNESNLPSNANSNLENIDNNKNKNVLKFCNEDQALYKKMKMRENSNRILLFSQLSSLNRSLDISTHLIHEKFQVILQNFILKKLKRKFSR